MFLGTSGARFSMIYQLRASGGMWIRMKGKNLVVDPGPGSLVKICDRLPELDPTKIDAIILTHCHMDHSNDLNVLAEAMTFGGRARRGTLVLPEDAVEGERKILLDHVKRHVQRLEIWKENSVIHIDDSIRIRGQRLKHHGVDCFGFTIEDTDTPRIGIISDTDYQEGWLSGFIGCKVLISNVTLLRDIPRIDHLSVEELPKLINRLKPDIMIMDHMGTSILESEPDALAESVSTSSTKVIAARDNMVFDPDRLLISCNGNNEDKATVDKLESIVLPVMKRTTHKRGKIANDGGQAQST